MYHYNCRSTSSLGFPTTKTEEEKEDQGPAAASQSHVICTNSSSTHGFTSGLQKLCHQQLLQCIDDEGYRWITCLSSPFTVSCFAPWSINVWRDSRTCLMQYWVCSPCMFSMYTTCDFKFWVLKTKKVLQLPRSVFSCTHFSIRVLICKPSKLWQVLLEQIAEGCRFTCYVLFCTMLCQMSGETGVTHLVQPMMFSPYIQYVFLCTHVVFWSLSSEDKEGPTLPVCCQL